MDITYGQARFVSTHALTRLSVATEHTPLQPQVIINYYTRSRLNRKTRELMCDDDAGIHRQIRHMNYLGNYLLVYMLHVNTEQNRADVNCKNDCLL